jgi:hypothetical protein
MCLIIDIARKQLVTDYINVINAKGSDVDWENTTSKGVDKEWPSCIFELCTRDGKSF